MKLPRIRTVLLVPVALFALLYTALAIKTAFSNDELPDLDTVPTDYETIAIFGASGTAGDGLLKAALADPGVRKIHVVTRRTTPRMKEGVESGKVVLTQHLDYLDYSALHQQMSEVTAVFWAIGISSIGVDEETYGMIHVDFPRQFVTEWLSVNDVPGRSFHYISSSDISADSSSMWAREKVRAERVLFDLARDTSIRAIAYRPDYIGPTEEEAHIGQDLLYWFFAPVRAAVRATEIGSAMIEVTARGSQFGNGDKIRTGDIVALSDAYKRRISMSVAKAPD